MLRRSAVALVFALASGCAYFDAPPEVSIEGVDGGLLTDPRAPLVLSFSKPPVPLTIRLEIALAGSTPGTQGATLFVHDPVAGDTGGTSALAADGSTMTITWAVPPLVGAGLVLLVEPGLMDQAGTVTAARREIPFGYASTLRCDMPVTVMQSGTFFFVTAVDQPVPTQITSFSVIVLDRATGVFQSRLTRAKRNPNPSRCTPACPATQVCRLLPMPECVIPSYPADSVDEFSDYVPDPAPPTGYSVANSGCAVDQDDMTSTFATNPVDVQIQSPMVTLRNAAQTASFVRGTDGTLRGTGTLTADAVLLGTANAGQGHGALAGRSIAGMGVPPGIPGP